MAVTNGDGSIILKTKVDTKGIKTGMSSMQSMVGKVGKTLAIAFSVKKIADFVKASVDAFADFEQLVGGVETLFKNSSDKVKKYANEAYKTVGMSANEYMANVTSFSASLISSLGGDTDKAAEVANEALISISDNANKMGSSVESVTMAFQGFAKQQYQLLDNLKLGYGGTKTEMERLLKDAQAITGVEYNIDNLADVYTAIGVIQEKLDIAGTTAKEAATTISGSAATMKAAWQNVLVAISGGSDMDAAVENFVNSFDTYFDNILPVVEKAISGIGILIEKLAPKLAETVGKAFIKEIPRLTHSIYKMVIGAFRGIYQGIVELFREETNELLEDQAEKTEETAKNQETVTDNIKDTNAEMKKTLAGFDDIEILSAETADNTDTGFNYDDFGDDSGAKFDGSPYEEEVSETLTAIMGIVGEALIAVGLILLFYGKIKWGLGFIIGGATSVGVSMQTASKLNYTGIIKMLNTIMGVAGGALLAIGIFLLWMGGVVGKGVAIGMIIAGGAMLVSSITTQAAFAPEDISAWLAIIMGIAGGALLALGVLLCMVGSIPTGVAMIVVGAVSLVTAIALNFDAVVEAIRGPIGAIMAIVGAAVLVLGIILTCCGVLTTGIALIAAGAIALITPIALNWNAIVDWVKGAWEAVKNFWNTYIAPVFTAEWWKNLGKKALNGLIWAVEQGVNGIIWLFEGMVQFIVDGLNIFLKGVDSVVEAVGNVFGADWSVAQIPPVSFGRVSIPRLAQGAVIPPNREFLAVLGDQKQGTNIEAPLQTIVDAFNIALAQNGGSNGGNTEVILEIDGREFGRAVVEQGNRENRRIGTRLVIA